MHMIFTARCVITNDVLVNTISASRRPPSDSFIARRWSAQWLRFSVVSPPVLPKLPVS